MAKRGVRPERLASLIKEELGGLLLFELSDPRVKDATITRVEVSGDLQIARVFFSLPEGANPDETLEGLSRASGFVRRQLGEVLSVRRMPELQFRFDKGLEHSRRIHELLSQLEPANTDDESET